MGRIHVLSENVANKIAAGEVVERPASVVKELLENALDAGARRIRVNIEAGGKKLIQVTDDGCGMVRDDAMLAFERHATSKIRNADDLLNIATLGFRGEALPSIASVSRLRLETRAPEDAAGTVVEIAGGKILTVEEAGSAAGNLHHRSRPVLQYSRAAQIPESRIDRAVAHRVAGDALRAGASGDALGAALGDQRHAGRAAGGRSLAADLSSIRQGDARSADPAECAAAAGTHRLAAASAVAAQRNREEPRGAGERRVKLHGFVSRPEIQKLNRNSIFIFVNGRLIRDRLVQHALTEAYRNIIPPTVYPVVLLFLEMPATEVDVNVHPSKTEVRFRQSSLLHDFIRDSVRALLMKSRPVPSFMTEMHAQPNGFAIVDFGSARFASSELHSDGSRRGLRVASPGAPAVHRAAAI